MKTKSRQKKQDNLTLQKSMSFLEWRISSLEGQYNEIAEKFAASVKQGVALDNIYALDWIRSLNFLYSDIAAHRHALRSMKYDINNP